MQLSLAGWSLQKLFRANKLTLLEFPRFAREQFGITAVELNSPFFASRDPKYLAELVAAAKAADVRLLNIAVDETGDLGAEDPAERKLGVEKYGAWIPIAAAIGCGVIRANSGGKNIKNRAAAEAACAQSFVELGKSGRDHKVAVVVENHGGISVSADAIVQLVKTARREVGEQWVGALPDFGNWPADIDRYAALEKILPYAKAVHAKVLDIDEQLHHPAFDLARCVKLARESGYDGYLGIEFEGSNPADPVQGVKLAVKKLTGILNQKP